MYIIVFILGAMFGGTVGVFTMCLMQINRLNDENNRKISEQINDEKFKVSYFTKHFNDAFKFVIWCIHIDDI